MGRPRRLTTSIAREIFRNSSSGLCAALPKELIDVIFKYICG
ncbi:hypothetical protein HMPREF0972_00409 [Actinomyces sp. oral taxon 848 str. F0332]|nr:hypothetical protein HMPREF0972_00409 [Actinomyces sp. oral taxon 848 str. F0332]